MNLEHMQWLMSSYVDSIIGAIIFFLLSYLFANHIVNFLKWIEDGLIKIPVVDLFFGSMGLILGLLIAYLLNLPLTDIGFKFVSQIRPLFFTVIIGSHRFQVGFRRREDSMGLLTRNRKARRKDSVELEPETRCAG